MSAVIPLFSNPVMVCSARYPLSSEERKFINEAEYTDNIGNSMSKSDDILEAESLKNIKEFINKNIQSYTRKLLKLDESIEIYITQSWLNRASSSQFHPMHCHPNSLISGVMFLSEGENHPPIRFHRTNSLFPLELNYSELNDFNANCRWFDPVYGQLILFPSSLQHDVGKNEAEDERITLSFNTFLRGPVGNASALTAVSV